MDLRVFDHPDATAQAAAGHIAECVRASDKPRFVFAVSGGRTPWLMLRALAEADLPWPRVTIVQVDERVAPEGQAERNLTHIRACLAGPRARGLQIAAMPVESPDLAGAADAYARTLRSLAGDPPVLDLVHLGLGDDGHTASLVPGDPVLAVTDREVAVTELYRGHRRMTVTYRLVNGAERILWLVTGAEKRAMLARLLAADSGIPAGRVAQARAVVFADAAAAG